MEVSERPIGLFLLPFLGKVAVLDGMNNGWLIKRVPFEATSPALTVREPD